MTDWSRELALLFALQVSAALYFLPLNAWLCGFQFRKSLSLFRWNALGATASWIFYRALRVNMESEGHVGLIVTLLVFLNAAWAYTLVRWRRVHEDTLLEERIGGWILFAPVLMIAVVITTPLLGAIFIHLVKAI